MFLHERFALFVDLGPIKLEEAVVARGFSLRTRTTTRIGGTGIFFLVRQQAESMLKDDDLRL
jgi:hypothetical protein